MKKFWQICELKDISRSFIEYTVAAVPEIWIVQLEDGTYICYWPKVNPGKKIREFSRPNEGGIWMSYNCRILMNREKFASYEEAREAEKDSQNFTLKEDLSEDEVTKNASTMDFEVSVNENVRNCNSTMDFEVSDDEMVIGNDTHNFNKANLMGAYFCSKKLKFTIEDDSSSSDESFIEKWPKLNSDDSQVSSYSGRFDSNNGDFLTSTLLSEAVKSVDNPTILTKIASIENNISTFVNNIKKDLDEIKVLINPYMEKSDVQCMSPQSDQIEINSPAPGMKNLTFDVGNASPSRTNNITIDLTDISPSRDSREQIEKEYGTSSTNSNERITPDELNFLNPKFEILKYEILNVPVSNVQVPPNTTSITGDNVSKDLSLNEPNLSTTLNEIDNTKNNVEKPSEMLRFPVSRKEAFFKNEELMDEAFVGTAREDALIKHLLPFKNETEVEYMNRTILTVFDEKYFVDAVSFKPEKDEKRLLITGTNTLNCWQASYETEFGPDNDNRKFQKHFRRFKSAKRAGNKIAQTVEVKGKAKRFKK